MSIRPNDAAMEILYVILIVGMLLIAMAVGLTLFDVGGGTSTRNLLLVVVETLGFMLILGVYGMWRGWFE